MDVVAYTLLAAAIAILSAVITSLPVLPHHITASASEKTEAALPLGSFGCGSSATQMLSYMHTLHANTTEEWLSNDKF